jgi:hypothetical protein
MAVIFIFTAQPLLHYHYTLTITIITVKCVSTGITATNSNYFFVSIHFAQYVTPPHTGFMD